MILEARKLTQFHGYKFALPFRSKLSEEDDTLIIKWPFLLKIGDE